MNPSPEVPDFPVVEHLAKVQYKEIQRLGFQGQ